MTNTYSGPEDGFFRIGGDPSLRNSAANEISELLSLNNPGDMKTVMAEMLSMAESGSLSDSQVRDLSDAVDLIQRMEAIDSPWVFGHRYMMHRFVSTDPMCPECKNSVPHRTMLACPTCNSPGPWTHVERKLESSYVHYLLVEQMRRLMHNDLILVSGIQRADGTASAIPRGGAKSTWLCEIASLWLLLTLRSRCLLILSNTIKQVTERAIEIKSELEDNELIKADFGVQEASRQERRAWTQEDFVLANASRLVARGAMQSMRGVKNRQYRPDVVISDDSDDEKFMTSSDMAGKLHEWWDNRVVPACHPNAAYMFHGTILGELALLYKTMNGHRGATFIKTIIRAIEDRPGCSVCGMPTDMVGPMRCPVCRTRTEAIQPCSFWGARFTVQALDSIRRRIGHWAWQSEFQQEAHDDSTSWFEKEWLDRSERPMAPLTRSARRVLPWSIISVSLTGDEACKLAEMADPSYARVPGDIGPYQLILHSVDPAWARRKPKDQKGCWMGMVGIGLTWDDKIDVFWIDRDRGKSGNREYREWMYDSWVSHVMPVGNVERQGQTGMIIETNGAGVLFQNEVEEHWSSVPMIPHHTGTEKHDLTDGIPGMASWFKDDRFILRKGGSQRHNELIDELIYELRQSGRSEYTDLLMTLWFAWAYANKWMRNVRDKARFDELSRRRAAGRKVEL